MLYCAVSNVTGSQTSTVAVRGDRVEYTCQILFHGNGGPSLWWSLPHGPHDWSYTVLNDTISWEVSTISVTIPRIGPVTVSPTCRVHDYRAASWSRVYFWQSTPITLSCEYNKKLIRRWHSDRELFLWRHRTRTTKYNRLVHKFQHRSTRQLCVRTYVYQIQWNNAM